MHRKVKIIYRYDWLAILYSVAYLVADVQENSKNKKMGFTAIIISYNFIFRLLVLMGLLIKAVGFSLECPKEEVVTEEVTATHARWLLSYAGCIRDNPADLNYDKVTSLVAIGYGLYGLGMTLSLLKILYWSQLHHVLGPLSISIKKVIKDLVLVATAYILFLFAFSIGIKHILELSQLEFCDEEEVHQVFNHTEDYHIVNRTYSELNRTLSLVEYSYSQDKTFNHFRSYKDALKTAFWSLFEPGHPEVVGCSSGEE